MTPDEKKAKVREIIRAAQIRMEKEKADRANRRSGNVRPAEPKHPTPEQMIKMRKEFAEHKTKVRDKIQAAMQARRAKIK